jgi:hypothetical protein
MVAHIYHPTHIIPALERLRKKDLKFEASVNYIGRPYLKKKLF